MSVVFLIVSVLILVIAVYFFVKKPAIAEGISLEEVERLKAESDQLKIAVARSEERASGLFAERDKADKLLQDERIRYDASQNALNQELIAEKNRMTRAEEQFRAQRERLAEQEKNHPGYPAKIPVRVSECS